MGMMGKLKETQQKIEETKRRLDTVLVDEQSNDGLLKVTLNKAIEKATNVNEAELGAVAKDGMPNIPGMDMFK